MWLWTEWDYSCQQHQLLPVQEQQHIQMCITQHICQHQALPRPLHCSSCPCPMGNNVGRLQEDPSYCSMPLCGSSGWKGHTGHAHPAAMLREQEDLGCPWSPSSLGSVADAEGAAWPAPWAPWHPRHQPGTQISTGSGLHFIMWFLLSSYNWAELEWCEKTPPLQPYQWCFERENC